MEAANGQVEHSPDGPGEISEERTGQDVHSPDGDQEMGIDPTAASSSNQGKAKEAVGKRTEEHERKWGTQEVSAGKWAKEAVGTASKRSIDESGASPTRQPQKVSKTGTGMEMDTVMPLGGHCRRSRVSW